MLSRILMAPFILGAAVFAYLTIEYHTQYSLWLAGCILILAALYTLSPYLDWLWYQKYPPKLDDRLIQILEKTDFYPNLSEADKKKFRIRVALYMIATDFTPQGPDSVPEDIKGMSAANIIQLTFGQEDYRLEQFEKIIIYPKPFPSPQHPRHFHASEIFAEDGVILIAADRLIAGTVNSKKFYNVSLHEYAKVFVHAYPEKKYPTFEESIWKKLEEISGFSHKMIAEQMNLPESSIDILPVSITFFFQIPDQFKAILPDVYDSFAKIFNMNPINRKQPVIDPQKITTKI